MSSLLERLPKVRGIYRENAELKSWFGVGGKAEVLFRPADISDLQLFLKNRPKDVALNVLGAASNVIIHDEGVKGVVIRLGGEFAKIVCDGELITSGAASLCGNVALSAKNFAIAEFEFLTGIPGSIGGAIAMNGGCYGSDMSQILVSAKALDYQGNLVDLQNADFGFFYRGNKAAKDLIFVEAVMKGAQSNSENIAKKISDLNKQREISQPIRAKTGGSTFKNPKDLKAWQLIDEAGCRGIKNGGAQISEKHCNFMVNNGSASAKELIDLGNIVKNEVKKKTGIDLQWEIKIIK